MAEPAPQERQITIRTLQELSLLAWGCLAMSLFWFAAGAI